MEQARYDVLFAHYLACCAAWEAGDFEALGVLEPKVAPTPDDVAEFLREFCMRAGRHVAERGAEAIGGLVWYLMDAGETAWAQVADAAPSAAESALLAVEALYRDCFAVHLPGWAGRGGGGGRLAGACYMLWDMNGGLMALQAREDLAPACLAVLERVLALESPACWESALHGLGHLPCAFRSAVERLVDGFLAARGAAVPEALRHYALEARAGRVK